MMTVASGEGIGLDGDDEGKNGNVVIVAMVAALMTVASRKGRGGERRWQTTKDDGI